LAPGVEVLKRISDIGAKKAVVFVQGKILSSLFNIYHLGWVLPHWNT